MVPGMPRFAANLSLLYSQHAFLDRFEAARRDGFDAVECQFPYEHAPQALADQISAHGLQLVLFNAPPGDVAAGDRGLAALPGREAEFRSSVARAMDYAQAVSCPRVHVMAGVLPNAQARHEMRVTFVRNLQWAARQAGDAGIDLLIEPINTRDMPGYFLNRQDEAHAIVAEVGSDRVRVQMDLYHCQIVEGGVAEKLQRYVPGGRVGHLQVAGVPGRGEPDDAGELNFTQLFKLIDSLGYSGHVGCEYRPRGDTSAGLAWLRQFRGS
jgi:hydroxypyruvate isomerase